MVNREEIRSRIVRLQQELRAASLDGALIVHPIDIYYFSATRQNGLLWVPVEGGTLLLVRKSLARARGEAVADDIRKSLALLRRHL